MSELLLPEGARLLHIGTPKTGTTSVQYASAHSRARLRELGVLYPGKRGNHQLVAQELLKSTPGTACEELADELGRSGLRSLITSELLAYGDIEVARAVRGLLGSNTHIIITMRSFASLLPSLWQEQVKKGLAQTLDEWLHAGFAAGAAPDLPGVPLLLERDGFNLISRWAEVFGRDHVTVLMVEKSEPDRVFHVFEDLLGLPRGFYTVQDYNRGLTGVEVELIRQFNATLGERLTPFLQRELVQYGLAKHLQLHRTPTEGEAKLLPTKYAAERGVELGARYVEFLRQAGVRVIGDTDELTRPSATAEPVAGPEYPGDLVETSLGFVASRALELAPTLVEMATEQQRRAEERARKQRTFRARLGRLRRRLF